MPFYVMGSMAGEYLLSNRRKKNISFIVSCSAKFLFLSQLSAAFSLCCFQRPLGQSRIFFFNFVWFAIWLKSDLPAFSFLNKPLLSGFRKLLKMWPRWKLTRNPFGNVLTHANKWGWYELHNLWSLKTSIQVTVVYWGLKVTQKDLSQFLLKIIHKIETDQPYHHPGGQASCSNKDLIWKSSFLQMIWIIGLGWHFVNRMVLCYIFLQIIGLSRWAKQSQKSMVQIDSIARISGLSG